MFGPRTLPFTMVALSIGAAIVYGLSKDYRRMAYWLFAAGITLSVTL